MILSLILRLIREYIQYNTYLLFGICYLTDTVDVSERHENL